MIWGSLPSDNLYKFKAFAGIIAIFFSLTYPATQMLKAQHDSIDVSVQLEKLDWDVQQFNAEEDIAKKQAPTPAALGDRVKRVIEIRHKLAEARGAHEKLRTNTIFIVFLLLTSIVGTFAGLALAKSGFSDWHSKVQVPADLQAYDAVRRIASSQSETQISGNESSAD